MSTYLPNVTDIIPQLHPFTPNFDFYNQALQVKHAQYQQGYEKMSNLYSSLLNSPMSRDENIQRRNQFFKDIKGELTKISGMDLSLPQNVTAASQVFDPIINDKDIANDMLRTKDYTEAVQAHEIIGNCSGKDCGNFKSWDTGLKEVNYRLEEFKKASTEEARKFGKISYTPQVKYADDIMKFITDNKIEITREGMSRDGRYKITYKNGDMLEEPLYNLIKTVFEEDGSISDMYQTKAYVARKDYAKTNAAQFGSEELAEQDYIKTQADAISNAMNSKMEAVDIQLKGLEAEKANLERQMRIKGIRENGPEAERYKTISEMIPMLEKGKKSLQNVQNAYSNFETSNLSTLRNRIDGYVANSLFDSDIRDITKEYAQTTSSITSKADEYALASFHSSLDFQKSVALKKIDFAYKIKELDYKDQLEKQKKLEELGYGEQLEVSTQEPGTSNQIKEPLATTNSKLLSSEVNGYRDSMIGVISKVYENLYQQSQLASEAGDQARLAMKTLFPGSNKPSYKESNQSYRTGYKNNEELYNRVVSYLQKTSGFTNLYSSIAQEHSKIKGKKLLVDSYVKVSQENNNKIKTSMKLTDNQMNDLDEDYIPFVDQFFDKTNSVVRKEVFVASLGKQGIEMDDASDIYDEMSEEYTRQYNDGTREDGYKVAVYYGEIVPGQSGGSLVVRPITINAQAVKKLSPNYGAVNSVLYDIERTGEIPEGSKATMDMFHQLVRDFRKGYDPSKEHTKVPNLSIRYESISDQEGKAKITLMPDRDWLEANIVGSNKETESSMYAELSKGLTFYIPKETANNYLEASTKKNGDLVFKANNNIVQIGSEHDPEGNVVLTRDEETGRINISHTMPFIPNGKKEIEWRTETSSIYKADTDKILENYEAKMEMYRKYILEYQKSTGKIIHDPTELQN